MTLFFFLKYVLPATRRIAPTVLYQTHLLPLLSFCFHSEAAEQSRYLGGGKGNLHSTTRNKKTDFKEGLKEQKQETSGRKQRSDMEWERYCLRFLFPNVSHIPTPGKKMRRINQLFLNTGSLHSQNTTVSQGERRIRNCCHCGQTTSMSKSVEGLCSQHRVQTFLFQIHK